MHAWQTQAAGLLPYFLARDSAQRRHVLVVRGTFSFTDVYTDILSSTTPVDDPLLQRSNASAAGEFGQTGP